MRSQEGIGPADSIQCKRRPKQPNGTTKLSVWKGNRPLLQSYSPATLIRDMDHNQKALAAPALVQFRARPPTHFDGARNWGAFVDIIMGGGMLMYRPMKHNPLDQAKRVRYAAAFAADPTVPQRMLRAPTGHGPAPWAGGVAGKPRGHVMTISRPIFSASRSRLPNRRDKCTVATVIKLAALARGPVCTNVGGRSSPHWERCRPSWATTLFALEHLS